MPVLAPDRYEGMSTLIAPEKLPSVLMKKIVNMELLRKEGWLRKRGAYQNVLTSGITSLQNMTELVDKNGGRQLIILDGVTLKESVYHHGMYQPIGDIVNDERTPSSTITTFHPVIDFGELRSGAGIDANENRPFWYGYIKERKRYNNAITIPAGKYLTDQAPYESGIFEFSISGMYPSSITIDPGDYLFYFAPIIDGYQNYFYDHVFQVPIMKRPVGSNYSFGYNLVVSHANASKLKRVTGFDIFVAKVSNIKDPLVDPAYFLERIDLNSDGKPFFTIQGNVGVTVANKIVIDDYPSWNSFLRERLTIHDITNNNYYQIDALAFDTPGAGQVQITVTPNAPAHGDAELEFFSRWWDQGMTYVYPSFFDTTLRRLGSEMFAKLGIPSGDIGIDDFRYKFGAMAGKRYFIFGTPDGFGYYSKAFEPDVIPSQNFIKPRKEPTGVLSLSDEEIFLFYKDSADRITVYGNANHRKDENALNIGCSNHQSIVKISDSEAAWMTYNGPWALIGRNLNYIGAHLEEWWLEKGLNMESCVGAYHYNKQWIIFYFPDYSDSEFSNGVGFVFDLRAYHMRKASAWWIFETDAPVFAQTLSDDNHLLTATRTKIVDWDGDSPTESFGCKLNLKIVRNPLVSKRINAKRLHLDFADGGNNNVTVKGYVDGTASAAFTLTVNPATLDKAEIIQYICETLELEIESANSTDDFIFKTPILEYDNKRF